MKEYSLDKYRFYFGENKVIAVSTYEGKTVRGVAKCDPQDNFDIELGKQLAAARCNQRIAQKRKMRADRELKKAVIVYDKTMKHMYAMNDYYEDACAAAKQADVRVTKLLEKM